MKTKRAEIQGSQLTIHGFYKQILADPLAVFCYAHFFFQVILFILFCLKGGGVFGEVFLKNAHNATTVKQDGLLYIYVNHTTYMTGS